MDKRKLFVLGMMVVAVFLFTPIHVQADSVILQELSGNVDQDPSNDTEMHAITTNGNASIILNGTMNNQALMLGSLETGPVILGDAVKTIIDQTINGYNVEQGPRSVFEVELHAIVQNRGNATVGGGFSNANVLNSVVVSAPATSQLEITQDVTSNVGNTTSIVQGMTQEATAETETGTALADKMNQNVSNVVNLAVSLGAGTGVSVIQDAGQLPGGLITTIGQTGDNYVSADTVTGESIVNGAQTVGNIINLAGANGGLAATQTYVADAESYQEGFNEATADSDRARPIPGCGDPAITMTQTVQNTVNRIELVKETAPVYLWGSQTYTGSATVSDTLGANSMDATMNGIGNASASGSQGVQALVNTIYVAEGGTTADSVYTQVGTVLMNDDSTSASNWASASAITGNADATVNQSVMASLNTISALGPLAGSYTQTTGGNTEQSFRNRVFVATTTGNATIGGTQTTINSINVISGVNSH